MNMHVSTLKILEQRFKPEDALAIAEAIDDAIDQQVMPSKLVTNESLKFQLAQLTADLKLDIAGVESRLVTKMITFGLTATGLIITSVFFMVLNLKK